MYRFTPLLFALVVLIAACQPEPTPLPVNTLDRDLQDALTAAHPAGANHFKLPDPSNLSAIPADPSNPLTEAKVELGKILFHDPILGVEPQDLAGRNQYSCASCHHVAAGFQAGRVQGLGEGGMGFGLRGEGRIINPEYDPIKVDAQPIRSPSTLNVAYQEAMLWNGSLGGSEVNYGTEGQWTPGSNEANNLLGFQGVETQALAGLKVHRQNCDMNDMMPLGYPALFDAAFPNVPQPDRYDKLRAALAIAAYERTMLPSRAPWQAYLNGDTEALTDAQKRGATLFMGKANCVSCHSGPALNAMEFHALGMGNLNDNPEQLFKVPADPPQNLGRGGFTQNPAEYYRFKTPQLYNLTDSPFYGHGGTFRSVREVVAYKNEAVPQSADVPADRLAPEFRPLGLTESEIDDLTEFLETALYDAELMRFVPESLPSGFCFPNNDAMSQTDLGCN